MKLAACSGKPVTNNNEFYEWPNVTKEEISALTRKFKSMSFRNYKVDSDITRFEEEFGSYTGAKYCFTLNSGTAALYSSLVACNLGRKDNVIVPAYGFFSAATSVANAGGKARFCDIDPDTFNIDPKSFESVIDNSTKAVIAVHIHGNPCDMDRISKIAEEHRLIVIEDACQAHGASYKGRKAGNLSDIAAFSFHISKNLPVMEGGAVTTNRLDLRDKAASTGLFPNYIKEKHVNLGYNFKFNGLFAAIALERLKKLDFYNEARQKNRDYLASQLKKFDFIILQKITEDAKSSNAMFSIRIDKEKLGVSSSLLDSRNRFLLALFKEGINCGVWSDKIIPEMDMFGHGSSGFPNAKLLADSTVYISGLHYPNSKKQMDLIVSAIEKISDNRGELKSIM